jgi:Matrixin
MLLLLLAQADYARTRAIEGNLNSSCLTWKGNAQLVIRANSKAPPSLPGTAAFTAIRRSINSWNAQMSTCSGLRLSEGPPTESRFIGVDSNSPSSENIIVFRSRLCSKVAPKTDPCWRELACSNKFDCWENGANVVAVTLTTYDKDSGRLVDADVEYNAGLQSEPGQFFFTTADMPACPPTSPATSCVSTDVENTTTHELGHLLGLAHVSTLNSVMYKSAPPGEVTKRVLDEGSKQFICDVYPKGKDARDCVVRPSSKELYPAAGCAQSTGLATLATVLAFLRLRKRNPA